MRYPTVERFDGTEHRSPPQHMQGLKKMFMCIVFAAEVNLEHHGVYIEKPGL